MSRRVAYHVARQTLPFCSVDVQIEMAKVLEGVVKDDDVQTVDLICIGQHVAQSPSRPENPRHVGEMVVQEYRRLREYLDG